MEEWIGRRAAACSPFSRASRAGRRLTLQDERTVSVPSGTTSSLVQENMKAASVLAYQNVVPIVRLVRSADNLLTGSGVRFSFMTAAVMSTADDEQAKGTRFFVISGYDITVAAGSTVAGASVNGQTFTANTVSGQVPALINPGGLILWKCANLDGSNANTLRFEIHLICRGP